MPTNIDVINKAEEFIDYKSNEVSIKRTELLEVEDLSIRQKLAQEVIDRLEEESDDFKSEACQAVARVFRDVVNTALNEVEKVARGRQADLTVIENLIEVTPSP